MATGAPLPRQLMARISIGVILRHAARRLEQSRQREKDHRLRAAAAVPINRSLGAHTHTP
jgi:hypothetical protein